MPHTPLETATTNPFQTMQTEYHADLAPRHTLACPSLARELVLIESADEWRSAARGDRILGGGSNTIGLNDAAYDKLIADAARETDGTKRAAILQQAEKRLIDNHSLIPVYYFVSKHLVKPYVKGYTANVMNLNPSRFLRIEK